ncbi:MAG: NAD-dependent epimerase/dehydratase family protein [bacterium]
MREKQATILITGSSGFLGYPVAKRLSADFPVVGFDRQAPPHPPPTAECLYVDVTSEPSLARGLDAVRDIHGARLASIIHFAAHYDFSGAPSPLYEEVTVRGTERLLRMARERFAVEQFIFSSTMLVHAPTVPGRPITEDAALDPRWAYPQSKVRTEEIIRREQDDLPTAIVRIAGVYDDLGHSVPLPRQIQRIYERTPEAYVYPGDLTHGQAMIHLDDVVDLYALLVARRHQLPSEVTMLAGEPETLGYGELQSLMGWLIHGETWRTRKIPKWLARVGAWLQEHLPLDGKPFIKPWMVGLADDHYELDNTRAHALLGWEPKRSLRATLPNIITGLLADPWAWYRENELQMPLWLRETEPLPAAAPARNVDGAQLERLRDILRPHGHARAEVRHRR